MTLRRYTALRASRGTVIPPALRIAVVQRDRGCVGPRLGMPGDCAGPLEVDHVRASGALGRKSRTEPDNLLSLCGAHHRMKTDHARTWRPVLLAYLSSWYPEVVA